jgi:signal transduction histidine kinase
VLTAADALARTVLQLYADKQLTIDVATSHEHFVRIQREDLDEMLGNLLDNACKWARSRVTVSSEQTQGAVAISVDDDGPGVPEAMREAVQQRGVRADQASPGSGLGLAIVRDLADLYGGSIQLVTSPLGGLRAKLTLPAS